MEIVFVILRFLLAGALYGFIGWALWLLWIRLRDEARRSTEVLTPPIFLIRDGDEDSIQQFARPEVIIGRQPGSDLRLDEKTISARHTRLAYHHGQWWADDLHSRNGTFVNEQRLLAALVLTSGDTLRCGSVTLRVEIGRSQTGQPSTEAGNSAEQSPMH